jgi:hypothetical protein
VSGDALSRLAPALDRLERAVARLEAALGADACPRRPVAEQSGSAASEADGRRLRAAADEIAARVDKALASVGRVLPGEA